jgi:hypothetical protein
MSLQQLEQVRDQLGGQLSGASPDLQKMGQLLVQAKVVITYL